MKKNKPKLTRCWVVREPEKYYDIFPIGVMLKSKGTPTIKPRKMRRYGEKWDEAANYKTWYREDEFKDLYGFLPRPGTKTLWDLEL